MNQQIKDLSLSNPAFQILENINKNSSIIRIKFSGTLRKKQDLNFYSKQKLKARDFLPTSW